MAKVLIEGQTIDLEDEIAKDDELLRAALKSAWPDAANASFTRETEGDVLTIKVTKKAGTKGSIIADLLTAPEEINPALVMQHRLAELDSVQTASHLQMVAMRPEIDDALKRGYAEIRACTEAKGALFAAPAEASNKVPQGF